MAEVEDESSLEYTSTWRLAIVCLVLVIISLTLARGIHSLGKILKEKKSKTLHQIFEKMKEELILLGFISLFITVFQGHINHICIPKHTTKILLPCGKNVEEHERLALEAGHCEKRGMEPLLTIEGMHQLDIFVFVLAIAHMVFCVLTMFLSAAKILKWRSWEEHIKDDTNNNPKRKYTHVKQHSFVKTHAPWEMSCVGSWVVSFFKQFYGSVTKTDYTTMRLGFIMTQLGKKRYYNFYKYMIRTLEEDFKKVVGIRWHLWLYVVIFLLLNNHGWLVYFWMSIIPLILLLSLGAKLEHIMNQLAQEVADKHSAMEGDDIVIRPSNDHFWFSQPELVLDLIHLILFQNAFEVVFFFWILTTYGFRSCMMGKFKYIILRLLIGLTVQVLCSYSTLPLYALVSQMGSKYKKTVFIDSITENILAWHKRSQKRLKKKSTVKPKDNLGKDVITSDINDRSQMQP